MRFAPAGAGHLLPLPIFESFVTLKFSGIGNRLNRWLRETWLETWLDDFMIVNAFLAVSDYRGCFEQPDLGVAPHDREGSPNDVRQRAQWLRCKGRVFI